MGSPFSRHASLWTALLMLICLLLLGCRDSVQTPEFVSISDEEALRDAEEIQGEVPLDLSQGLHATLWASEKLVGDPVSLDIDHTGRAWITVTNRRYTSSLDIRNHPEWTTPSLSLETVEERRAFLQRELTRENSEDNSAWLPDHNEDGAHDWRDLMVEEEEVYWIEDLTRSGSANHAQLFFRGFNDAVSDLAGTVLHHDGEVFVGAAPDMWRLRDTTGDGSGDEKESISHGYGVHVGMSGHGISGLVVGPDGRLYWGIGDIGLNVVDQDGNRWEYPRHGAILRSDPDGSNFEVFASGLRNAHEFAFDKYGNLITVDNDADFPDEFERLLYVIDGSDAGWRTNWQFGKYTDPKNNDYNVWVNERYFHPRFEGQAAHVLPAIARYHTGPAGLSYNPGTALNEQWQNHFFVATFAGAPVRSGIDAFSLQPDGASFQLATDEEVVRGILATGIDFGPDGALYVADWVDGWATNDEGRIWKIESSESLQSSLREETENLLNVSFQDQSPDDLIELMGHADMRVRQKAQFELVSREATSELANAVEQGVDQLRRIHGIWGIAQLGRQDPQKVSVLVKWLDDDEPEIRAQAARALGDVRFEPSSHALIERLADQSERVRFFATEALGRIGYRPATGAIIDMLETNDDQDIYLRQAGAIALARIGEGDRLEELADHPSSAVRKAVVVALGRLKHAGVVRFLSDHDEDVVTDAARAINDDEFIGEALPELANMLDQREFTGEPLMRRAINANLHSGRLIDARRLARFATSQEVSEELRIEALGTLEVWPNPSLLDRVTGNYRGRLSGDEEVAREAIASVSSRLLQDASAPIREAAVGAINGVGYGAASGDLIQLIEDDESPSVRIAALRALQDLDRVSLEGAFATALEDEEGSVRRAALRMLPDIDRPGGNVVELLEPLLESGNVEEQQDALEILGRIDHPGATEVLGRYMDRLMRGDVAPEIELDIVHAVEERDEAVLKRRLEEYRDTKPTGDYVEVYREALYGGDAQRGQTLFTDHGGAQCMRCHAVGGTGSDVGPDLTTVGSRLSREELLEAMVAPGARLAPGFGVVTLILEDGESLTGIVEEETESSIELRTSGQQVQMVDRASVVDRLSNTSPMPTMRGVLTRGELRDLVEYLTTFNRE